MSNDRRVIDDFHTPGLLVRAHPALGAILAEYPVGTVIQFADGQHFVVGHRGTQAIVIVPITDSEAERLCGSDEPTTSASSPN